MVVFPKGGIKAQSTLLSTYSKGEALYKSGAIEKIELIKGKGGHLTVAGDVLDEKGQTYGASIKFEPLDDKVSAVKINDCDCACPAKKGHRGFCKHITALALETNRLMELDDVRELLESDETKFSFEAGIDDASKTGNSFLDSLIDMGLENDITKGADGLIDAFSGSSIEARSATSSKLYKLMNDELMDEYSRYESANGVSNLGMEVTLNLAVTGIFAEFRVGDRYKYVIKNIAEFCEAMNTSEVVNYGKNLEFKHELVSFAPEYRPLVKFLSTSIYLEEKYKNSDNYSKYYYRASGDKTVEIKPHNYRAFFDTLDNIEIELEGLVSKRVKIVKDDPTFTVKITGDKEKNLATIEFPEYIYLDGLDMGILLIDSTMYVLSKSYVDALGDILKAFAEYVIPSNEDRFEKYNIRKKENFRMQVSKGDFGTFAETILPRLEKHTNLEVTGINFDDYSKEDGVCELRFDVDKTGNIICSGVMKYGDKIVDLGEGAVSSELSGRNAKAEARIKHMLNEYFLSGRSGKLWILPKDEDDALARLIDEGIPKFEELADTFASDAFKKLRVVVNKPISGGLAIKGNLLTVSWDVEGMSREELYEVLGAYRQNKKYFRLKSGEVLRIAGTDIEELAQLEDELGLTKKEFLNGQTEVQLFRALHLNALMMENKEGIKFRTNKEFDMLIKNFESLKNKKHKVPKIINATLREYQKEGFNWACALSEFSFGGILADDMGLGKTLQMISFLATMEGCHHMVICPASLVYNWEAEIEKFAPSLKVNVISGSKEERNEQISHCNEYDINVTSYDSLRRDIDEYVDFSFDTQIIDEAQYIKNPGTMVSKAVKAINSRMRFALTGTPIENRLSELWSIFDYLMPGYLYKYKNFKERFEEHIVGGISVGEDLEKENDATLRALKDLISPFYIRRKKVDVLKDLPEKVEKVVYSKMGPKQEQLYYASEKNLVDQIGSKDNKEFKEDKLQILAELMRLRQLCCDPKLAFENYNDESAKLETCIDLVESAVEGGHRILLFSQFTSMLDKIEGRLAQKNITTLKLTGQTPKLKRMELVEKFQEGKVDVFLISLKAGGTGLNLTAADMVIHYDPWWNVAAQNQATDRAHRFGQTNTVTVVKLIVKGTIEERIMELQNRKKELADMVLSAEGVAISSLSRDDLLKLFNKN